MGTNCCEDIFSTLGNLIQVKHIYSLLDIWNNMPHITKIKQLRTKPNGLKFPSSDENTKIIWPKQFCKPLPDQAVLLKPYPQRKEESTLRQKGEKRAREYASSLSMCPKELLPRKYRCTINRMG